MIELHYENGGASVWINPNKIVLINGWGGNEASTIEYETGHTTSKIDVKETPANIAMLVWTLRHGA
jgi:hypothetical protein